MSIDTRTLKPGQMFVAIAGPNFDGHDFVAQAVRARRGRGDGPPRHPGAAAACPWCGSRDTTQALKDLGRHVRLQAAIPVAAVTGSAGKTTTKEMLAALLSTRGEVLKTEGNLNNQYGLPLTLLRLTPGHRFAVLELGMSAAGELRELSAIARPDVAIITMVAPVHLEFFKSVDAIADAKAEILEGLGPDGAAVLNWEDPRLRRVRREAQGEGDLVRARPRLRRLGGELARHRARHALRHEDGRRDPGRRAAAARAALPAELPRRRRRRASPRHRAARRSRKPPPTSRPRRAAAR